MAGGGRRRWPAAADARGRSLLARIVGAPEARAARHRRRGRRRPAGRSRPARRGRRPWPSTSSLDGLRTAIASQLLVQDRRRRRRRRLRLPPRARSRRPPTTTSCPANAGASIGPTPRRWPSADPAAGRSPPATGRSSPTTGRPRATTGRAVRRPRPGRRRRVRGVRVRRRPAPVRARARALGQRRRTRGTWPGSTGSSSSTERPMAAGWPATPGAPWRPPREAIAALGRGRRSGPRRRDARARSVGRCGSTSETEAALEAHEAAVAVMPAEPPTAERARVLSGLRPDPDAARPLVGIDGPVRARPSRSPGTSARARSRATPSTRSVSTWRSGATARRRIADARGRARDRPRGRQRR